MMSRNTSIGTLCRNSLVAASVGLALLLPQGAAGQGAVPVDLELVLAVDTSSSVSGSEYELQMKGLAEAFRNPAVVSAIRSAGDLGIAVTLVQWAESSRQERAVPWRLVRNAADAAELARAIDEVPRLIHGGATGISFAIAYGVQQLENNGYVGLRRVIDISGDGRANHGPAPSRGRDAAVARGVTINALAILDEIPMLDRYFRSQVIGGSGAFVMVARDWVDFAEAIVLKLIREIADTPVATLPDQPADGRRS